MEVSVVIPVRLGRSVGLGPLIDALEAQVLEATSFEVIIVDDGSDPPIRCERARVIRLDRPSGSYAARNAGIAIAKGRALAFTDADCVPDREWLQAGLTALETAPRAAGHIEITSEAEPNLWERLDRARFLRQERYVEEGFGATANLFVRREVLDAIGLFDARLVSGGDAEHGRRARAFPIAFAPHAIVRHPARRSAREVLAKAHRVGFGLGQQVRLHGFGGLLDRASDRLAVRPSRGSRQEVAADHLVTSLGLLAIHSATAIGAARGLLSRSERLRVDARPTPMP